ncbi:MAG: hypothetical protein EZS28_032794 [Streblomastix strix]|uniref:Uncharacterized protein n=1 Tax=Streblomastix strix TaxID=222440 RepID=A0A5J4UMN6_9EUKA|nr:MAG: hypothetical protein EZS28_032794 [Streblomastix strix]
MSFKLRIATIQEDDTTHVVAQALDIVIVAQVKERMEALRRAQWIGAQTVRALLNFLLIFLTMLFLTKESIRDENIRTSPERQISPNQGILRASRELTHLRDSFSPRLAVKELLLKEFQLNISSLIKLLTYKKVITKPFNIIIIQLESKPTINPIIITAAIPIIAHPG